MRILKFPQLLGQTLSTHSVMTQSHTRIMVVISQVVRQAEMLVAQVQQYVRSDQDTNPVVSDAIQAHFEAKGELLQLAEQLGELKLREYANQRNSDEIFI